MTAALHPNLRNKLAKACSRMDSKHDGERAAAALLATRILASAGLSWSDVICNAPPATTRLPEDLRSAMAASAKVARSKAAHSRRAYRHPDDERRIARFQSELRFVHDHLHMLTEAERQDLERRCIGPLAWSARAPKRQDCVYLSSLADVVRQRMEEAA